MAVVVVVVAAVLVIQLVFIELRARSIHTYVHTDSGFVNYDDHFMVLLCSQNSKIS